MRKRRPDVEHSHALLGHAIKIRGQSQPYLVPEILAQKERGPSVAEGRIAAAALQSAPNTRESCDEMTGMYEGGQEALVFKIPEQKSGNVVLFPSSSEPLLSFFLCRREY
jgi:hypothetical protein